MWYAMRFIVLGTHARERVCRTVLSSAKSKVAAQTGVAYARTINPSCTSESHAANHIGDAPLAGNL
jgi:hypothetical protein